MSAPKEFRCDTDHAALARLERAEEALRAAQHLLDGGFAKDCVNRAHLAMELGALALLATKGLTFKSHTGVQTLFYDHVAKPGLLPMELPRRWRRLCGIGC